MPIKYSLPTGEVVSLEFDDLEQIDFTTIKGKEVMQEILAAKEHINHYADFDDAIESDMGKYSGKEDKSLRTSSFDEFKKDLYKESLENEL